MHQLLTSRKDSHVKKLLRTDNVAIGYLPAIDKYAFYVRNWAPPPGQESRGPSRRIGLCLTDDLRDFGAPRDVFGLDAPADPSLRWRGSPDMLVVVRFSERASSADGATEERHGR